MEVQEKIMSLSGGLSQSVREIFTTYSEVDKTMFRKMLDDGVILKIPNVPPPESICAVDGARVEEKLYAADLLVAVATSAEGNSSPVRFPSKPKVWGDILESSSSNPRLSATAMACLEVALLAELNYYAVRILDGSFATPIFGISEGLATKKKEVLKKVFALIADPEMNLAESLHHIYNPSQTNIIIAIPKSDNSVEYVEKLNHMYDKDINLRDRLLAANMLRPNELLKPTQTHITHHLALKTRPDVTVRQKRIIKPIEQQVGKLIDTINSGQLWFTYFKPENSNTVIKFEFFAPNNEMEATKRAEEIAGILNNETHAPHLLEPYPQALVDKKAKVISPSVKALQNLILSQLTEEEREQYGHLIMQNYRT